MTGQEAKAFQIKTILLAAVITILSNVVFSAFGYYREDTKDIDLKLEKKVNVVDYNEDKVTLEDRLIKYELKWDMLIRISTENQTDIKWLRSVEETKRNK